MRTLLVIAILFVAASAATFARYESFSPCDWMARDLEAKTGWPSLAVEARIKAYFLLDGIVDPDPVDCLFAWWGVRREGLPPET